jgi:predicted nucleic acid-binding protein
MSIIVLDTCVLVDMFMSTRPRHATASRLHTEMVQNGLVARIPAFALFEVWHAIHQEKRLNGGKLLSKGNIGLANGLTFDLVPVDESFTKNFLDLDLPEIRAGDLVFAALAKGEGLPLVTEDESFRKKAQDTGIQVYTTGEYLQYAFGITV